MQYRNLCQRRLRLREAGRGGGTGAGVTAGPVTVRLPSEAPQPEQRNSWSSPLGSTKSNRSRTGRAEPHLGQ